MNHRTKLSHSSTTITSEVTALSSQSRTADSSAVGQEIINKISQYRILFRRRHQYPSCDLSTTFTLRYSVPVVTEDTSIMESTSTVNLLMRMRFSVAHSHQLVCVANIQMHMNPHGNFIYRLTLILRRSRTGTCIK